MYRKTMVSISGTEKRGRGRPRVDPTSIHLSLVPAIMSAVDAYIIKEGGMSRPEAVRRLLSESLKAKGYLKGG